MAKDNYAELALEALEPIRQAIRRLCIQDQFTWEQSWKAVLSDQTHRGLLPPDVFQQTLALNGIVLPRKSLGSLTTHFQQPNGGVHTHRFLQWIDLSKPTDHVDPELAFARLPQPYRRIMKVLEQDILDAAWETIQMSSATYKAETAAALSARSARANGVPVPQEQLVDLHDDYAAAKKRCCKIFTEVTRRTEATVALVRVHCRLPFAVVAWEAKEAGISGVTLDLVHTERSVTVASVPVALLPLTVETCVTPTLQLIDASELRSRPVSAEEDDRFVLAVHVQEEVSAGDTTSSVDHVLLYEFTASLRPVRLVAFAATSETIQSMTLSHDASLLAVTIKNKSDAVVYSVRQCNAESPPSALTLFTTLPSDASARAVFFLSPPVVDTPSFPSTLITPTRPYAVAVVAAKCLVKYRLPRSDTGAATVAAKWSHLSRITCSSMDATSQFVTVGLADGMVVVWDLLSDRDHVMLPPPPSSYFSSASEAVDKVVLIGDRFVVALSLASQRLCFHDIANRTKPTLLRIVTPPPSTSKEAASIRLVSLSSSSPLLDLPVAIVTYSNGYALLYDVRTGEALASLRVPKQSSSSSSETVFPAMHSVVALTPSPVIFNWSNLLTTACPTLPAVLQDKRLDPTTENLKRGFLALNAKSPFSNGATLSIGAKSSLHSLLLASAGHQPTTRPTESDPLLSVSQSSSSLSNSDSRTSLASSVTASSQHEHELLLALPIGAAFPYKPNLDALFERFCQEEKISLSSGDAKLHRRRNELLKILTAAW